MQLTAREDIEAPIDRVFAELSDFENIERQAMRRGIDVRRTDSLPQPGKGTSWTAKFKFRGKSREAVIEIVEYAPPDRMRFQSVVGGLTTATVLELVALSRNRTRVSIASDLTPRTLSARLLVQSLKLAKGGIDKRFRKRVGLLAKDLENRLKSTA